MAEKRKADSLAGKGSFADKLRIRRQMLESGDIEGSESVFRDQLKMKKKPTKPASPYAMK